MVIALRSLRSNPLIEAFYCDFSTSLWNDNRLLPLSLNLMIIGHHCDVNIKWFLKLINGNDIRQWSPNRKSLLLFNRIIFIVLAIVTATKRRVSYWANLSGNWRLIVLYVIIFLRYLIVLSFSNVSEQLLVVMTFEKVSCLLMFDKQKTINRQLKKLQNIYFVIQCWSNAWAYEIIIIHINKIIFILYIKLYLEIEY